MSLFAGVMVLSLVVTSRESQRSLIIAPAENRGQNAMERIRMNIQQARFGTVAISNGGRRIDYLNVNLSANINSAIYRDNNGNLIYVPAVNAPNATVNWGAIQDVNFSVAGAGTLVSVVLSMPATFRNKDAGVVVRDTLYVRN